jgi:hypothetical protein
MASDSVWYGNEKTKGGSQAKYQKSSRCRQAKTNGRASAQASPHCAREGRCKSGQEETKALIFVEADYGAAD